MPRAFVLDHFDSFTHNVAQGLLLAGAEVQVARADRCTLETIRSAQPHLLVLSPGPGHPSEAQLALEAIAALQGLIPILGICLGMQIQALAFGGDVDRAVEPVHGKVSLVRHTNQGLFTNLPSPFAAGRYHSLCVTRMPVDLKATAYSEEGTIMGLRHPTLPLAGVQFHPDSFLTPLGLEIFRNALLGRF